MPHLVGTLKDVKDNISNFQTEITDEMKERLSYARAWYAIREEDGKWKFGPSKFIGYRNMTASKYLKKRTSNWLDGRKTESKLSDWFMPISENDELLWVTLHDELAKFLHKYGKSPSAKMRINVDRMLYQQNFAGRKEQLDDLDADLIIAFVKRLSPKQQARIKRAI